MPLHFSPDGTLLAAAGKEAVVLWNVRRKQAVPLPARGVPLAFLSSEELLVRDDDRLRLWNVATGRQPITLPDGWVPIRSANAGPVARDGALVALRRGGPPAGLGAGDVSVWDMRS